MQIWCVAHGKYETCSGYRLLNLETNCIGSIPFKLFELKTPPEEARKKMRKSEFGRQVCRAAEAQNRKFVVNFSYIFTFLPSISQKI